MEWVAIDVHIAGDAVTHRLADRFRLRVAEAAGLLALTFAGMVQHARDGSLADITDSQLEAWATWHGKKGQFAAFFREQLCDETGTVRAWEEYNGRSIRRAEAAKERSRAYREQQEQERNRARTEREQNANRMHTQTHTVCRTRPDQTVPNSLTAKSGGADAPADRTIVVQESTPLDHAPPVRSPRNPAPPAKADKPDPLPKPLCDAAYERYISRVGAVDYGRFRKALLPVYRSPESAHPTLEELSAGIEAFREARAADQPRWFGSYTVEKFAQSLHEYVRLGQMPLMNEWGEPTERGRAAKVVAA